MRARRVLLAIGACAIDVLIGIASPLQVVDDFNDGVIDPKIWMLIPNGDPGLQVVERNGYLRIFGRRSLSEAQTGLETRSAFPSDKGFEVRVKLQDVRRVLGFALEIHNTTLIHPQRYHITLMYGPVDYGLWWCYFGPDLDDGCRDIGRVPAFGTENLRFHEMRITYNGSTREVCGSIARRVVDGILERVLGCSPLPLDFGPFIVRLFAQSSPKESALVDYRVDDFELIVGE